MLPASTDALRESLSLPLRSVYRQRDRSESDTLWPLGCQPVRQSERRDSPPPAPARRQAIDAASAWHPRRPGDRHHLRDGSRCVPSPVFGATISNISCTILTLPARSWMVAWWRAHCLRTDFQSHRADLPERGDGRDGLRASVQPRHRHWRAEPGAPALELGWGNRFQ